MVTKAELRSRVRDLKKAAAREDMEAQSLAVCHRVMRLPRWREARTVLLYHALPDEVDTQRLLEAALREGKTVLLPVVVGDELELRCYEGTLCEGAFHILEPTSSSPLFDRYADIDLALIPGMGFDDRGHRLGRGRGYYDKLLSHCQGVYKVGICFGFQRCGEVPFEPHDILMDEVISG